MAEQSKLNGAPEGITRGKRVKKVKPHWKRGRMVGKLAKKTGIRAGRIRDTLRAHGYDYPWDDEERAVAILEEARLLKGGLPAKANGHDREGRKTNYPEQRSSNAPEVARELKMSDKTLYVWLRKAGYEPPWEDRRRILECAISHGGRKPAVQKRARQLLAEMNNSGPVSTSAVPTPSPAPEEAKAAPSPVNNRVLEALTYLRQAEAAIFADIRAKRIKSLTGNRALRRAMDAKAALEGDEL